ncbi:Uncharacterized protein FKW44_002462 [Caligus rogercresseyi]|uniref:Mos1 transposase HTH domain-containing protein n=1 Tax=Caligus rogercresseyi TaxID=217165 RepID=A0A7T8QWC5_CALRO|nr:Uncharacterized protein FKW44_002462 [Caligus rogercresseyi]
MDTSNFRSYFFIRIKLAKTVNEIHWNLISTFPDLSTIKKWRKDFDNGSFAMEKNTPLGRPMDTRTPKTIVAV